ncbi:YdaU family protein [Thauera aromatica]|uniref:YdaU family protein n=1 Tax=Thauera aromatica TaxID=59405 RepID=UPI001FFC53BA|nr:YdaU family protein [Thauera aromatica]MCK2097538.1 YdaU family protein [Thauera aromatica]
MNYYEHHLGDYAKDTGHLTMLEHGAYRILLDRYYSTEAGIPAAQAYRLARARSEEERQAVDVVLEEFFELVDGVWINGRAEEEIAGANARIDASRQNGKKGGRPKKNPAGSETETQQKPSGLSVGSETETQQKAHQAPSTKHQSPGEPKASESLNGSSAHEAPHALAPAAPFPEVEPTEAGAICQRFRVAGIQGVNPSHPKLLALLQAGITADELCGLAEEPSARGKGMAWVLAAAEGRRRDAANVSPLPRASPTLADRNRQAADEAKRLIFGEG